MTASEKSEALSSILKATILGILTGFTFSGFLLYLLLV